MAYITVSGPAEAEVLVRKSRFIAHVAPAQSEAEAWSIIEGIRAQHGGASHNCFAFKAGTAQRMSDDGEPSGTAGRPIFDVLDKQGLSDTVIVVTRYFGGILLGAGGLVRAYSQAAVAGLEAAGLAEASMAVDLKLALEYPLVGKVQHLLLQRGVLTLDTVFGEEVLIEARTRQEEAAALESALAELSSGRIRVQHLQEILVGADLRPLHGG